MAEAVVNVVVEQLISATTEWLTEEISLITGVEEELENMSTKMRTVQKVLDDAENQSLKDKMVKEWLVELQDIAYDMEDVMDEWNTIVLKQKMEDPSNHEISSSSSSKSACSSFKRLNCFRTPFKQVGWRRDIAISIKEINKRMNIIFVQIENLNLIAKVLGNTNVITEPVSTIDRTTTSSIQESQIHGRDGDKNYLLSKVLNQSSAEHNNAHVISILGAGGLGKTTLAQLVYNHENVKQHFDFKIWVCVSDPFDEFKVAQGILEGLDVDHHQMTHLQTLHESIKKKLSKKKFLLVLDDVWDDDSKKWERLRLCLEFGASESRTIVTTRIEEVAKIMSSLATNIFKPSLISTLDCWLLMCHAAFHGKREEDCSRLEDIGKKIAKKCKGLPLAAKVLGGLLRSKDTLEQWTEVLNSEIWKLEKVEMEIFPHLFLSYKQLTSSLKRCFSFCSLFPKDHEIKCEELISFWMAQIQIDSRTIKDNKMVTGQRYIELLKSSAFLEDENSTNRVKMHDVMHDFALHLSGHEFLSLVKVEKSDSSDTQEYAKNMKARHLFVHGTINPTSLCDVRKLRTCHINGVPRNVTLDLFKQLQHVRALYLLNCDLEEIPKEIGKLIHLRTVDLRNNANLHSLPETMGELYNLEYLWLRQVNQISLTLPKSLGKLINLQGLEPFPVESGNSNLGILKNLNKLSGFFEIVFRSSYDDEDDAKHAKLTSKKHITELSFDFGLKRVSNDVFEALEAPPGVQFMLIRDFMGERFLPNWITSLSYLKELRLYGGTETLSIPPLGKLPSLETLFIGSFDVLKLIGREFLGIGDNNQCSFPKLLRFELVACNALEEWEDIKAEDEDTITVMPKLKCLQIFFCNNLKALPHRLICKAASLEELTSYWSLDDEMYSIQQSPNLRLLNILGFNGRSLPNCILSLKRLIKLLINHSRNVEYLPALGKLPCLEDLTLIGLSSLSSIGREFLGMENNDKDIHVVFPKLVRFVIESCDGLKEWEDIEGEEVDTITVMPQLQTLVIISSGNLKALPSRLLCKAPRLKMLDISGCSRLLEKSIREDQQLMLHIPTIKFKYNESDSSPPMVSVMKGEFQ